MNRSFRRILASFAVASLLVPTLLQAASRKPARSRHGMIACTSPIASEAGIEVLQKGGNAIDAAVAVALALAVTWPLAGNLGGGGFMLIHRADGAAEVIDYRERAPIAATPDMYLDESGKVIEDASLVGHRASAVPGTVAGLALALERHGTMEWNELVEPARKLAADGFPVSDHLAKSLREKDAVRVLSKFPESRRIFLRDGNPWEPGERFVQPELAATLARLKTEGPREFYEGATARSIVTEMRKHGGLITAEDLASYEPAVRKPLRGRYRGYEILTPPPPSSGGVLLIQMLNVLEPFDLRALGLNSSAYLHLLVETMRRAFADRATWLGDADFVEVPIEGLISEDYAEAVRKTIDLDQVTPSREVGAGDPWARESSETTHFTIIDAAGNVVSNTYTLNGSFGSGVTVPGTGMLLNNEMDDFTLQPGVPNLYEVIQSELNAIEPRKRPLSSMTPTIVLRDGKVVMGVGSPGGPRIISTVLQVILNVVDHGMDIQEAIDATRFHHQWLPDEIRWEPRGVNADTRRILEAMGHRFRERSTTMGDVQAIMVEPESGMRLGASDPRSGGKPVGY